MKLNRIIAAVMVTLVLASCGKAAAPEETAPAPATESAAVAEAPAEPAAETPKEESAPAASEPEPAAVEAEPLEAAPASGGLPLVQDKITMSLYWPADTGTLAQITDFNENPVWQAIEQQTNVHIEWFHGDSDQRTMMINSGDMSDMIWDGATYPGGLDKAILDGAYLRLNELMEQHAPNYMALLDANPGMKLDAVSDEGNIAAFGMLEDIVQGPFTGIGVRQDWLNDLGLATPVTYDDWHNVFTAFKNDLGVPAPLSLYPDLINNWIDCGDWAAGYDVVPRHFQIDGTVKYGPTEQGYQDYIRLMAKWYAEGLIDKDFTTRDWDGVDLLKYTNQSGAWFTGFWLLEFHKMNAEDPNYHEVAVASPVVNVGEKNHFRQTNRNYRSGHETVVTSKCADPVIAVRWLDNLYSEENYILMNYGIEGQGHTIAPDGEYLLTDLVTKNPLLDVAAAMRVYMVHSGPMRRIWWREQASYSDDERACEAIWYTSDDTYTIPATTTFSPAEGNLFSTVMSDIETYVLEKSLAFITGAESLDGLDAFQEQIRSMGIDDATAAKQASLDRYYAR